MIMLNMLSAGGKLVTIPRFGPQIFLNVLKEHQPTFAYLVPPLGAYLVYLFITLLMPNLFLFISIIPFK